MTGENRTRFDMAAWTLRFFRDADNKEQRGLIDLDPRKGYVRLGETRLAKEAFGYSHVRGLMNPKGDLQAVFSGRQGQLVLTLSAGLEPVVQSTTELPLVS